MTHPTLQPLMILLEHAERDRDEALVRQREAQAVLDAARSQAQQIEAYRDETQGRWSHQFRSGVTVSLMHCYHDFVNRLHGAVDQQSERIERLEADTSRCQDDVLAAELRVASVRKLIERREAVLARSGQRAERRAEDEFASRATWHRLHDDGAASVM